MLVIKLSSMKSIAPKVALFTCEVDQKYFNNYTTKSAIDTSVICMGDQDFTSIEYLPAANSEVKRNERNFQSTLKPTTCSRGDFHS